MKKKVKKSSILRVGAVAAFAAAVALMIVAISGTVSDMKDAAIAKTADAILASAGVSDEKLISVPVVYYDQKMDACADLYDLEAREAVESRQFEWKECGYYNSEIEQGLADFYLSEDYLPVATGNGQLTSNRGIDFSRWFKATEGLSASYAGILKMNYRASGAEFSFVQDEFYPLDAAEFSKDDAVNADGHNHLFTMNFAVPFTVLKSGEESFAITADDDTFVYVGNELVIDMGGVHEATTGRFYITEEGEVFAGVGEEEMAYTGVKVDGASIVRIFHADRNSSESTFSVVFSKMNLSITNTKLADADSDEIQVAYDPTDPSYIGPLGETSVFRPDETKGLVILATIEGFAIIVLAISLIYAVSRCLRHARN